MDVSQNLSFHLILMDGTWSDQKLWIKGVFVSFTQLKWWCGMEWWWIYISEISVLYWLSSMIDGTYMEVMKVLDVNTWHFRYLPCISNVHDFYMEIFQTHFPHQCTRIIYLTKEARAIYMHYLKWFVGCVAT